jgi:hypothetical protein
LGCRPPPYHHFPRCFHRRFLSHARGNHLARHH